MTVKNAIEILGITFDVDKTLINLMLDEAQKEFVRRTEILEGFAELTNIGSNTAWSLPSDFIRVEEVMYYDSNGKPVYEQDMNIQLKWKVRNGEIHFYSSSGGTITGLPSVIDKAYIRYTRKPKSVFDVTGAWTQEFEVPEDYHGAIISKAREKLFRTIPVEVMASDGSIRKAIDRSGIRDNWEVFEYWVKEAKKEKNSKGKKGYDVVLYPDAGKYELPKETLKGLSGATALSPI